MTIGEKIRTLRQRAGLSQSQLADALTVSRAAVAKWENENGTPDIENLKTLAAYFACDVDVLINEAKELEEPKPQPNGVPCGKSCIDCTHKEALQCPCCKHGPGKKYQESCDIAKCARDRSPDGCMVCSNAERCAILKRKEMMSVDRIKKLEKEQAQKDFMKQHVDVLMLPLRAMFWIYIVENIRSLLFAESVLGRFPVCYTIGQILAVTTSVVIIFFLLRMRSVNPLYRSAALGAAAFAVCQIISLILTALDAHTAIKFIVSLAGTGASITRIYYEYTAYSEDMTLFDTELAEKWSKLKLLAILSYVGFYGGLLIAQMFALIGALMLIAGVICMLIVLIKELYYRYLTAEAVSIPAHLL